MTNLEKSWSAWLRHASTSHDTAQLSFMAFLLVCSALFLTCGCSSGPQLPIATIPVSITVDTHVHCTSDGGIDREACKTRVWVDSPASSMQDTTGNDITTEDISPEVNTDVGALP